MATLSSARRSRRSSRRPDDFPRDVDPRLGLYRTFHAIWSSANIEEDPRRGRTDDPEASPRRGSSRITPLSRQALLLTAMEGFTPEDAGYLIDAPTPTRSSGWSPRRWPRSSARPAPRS